ncbi:MAG TPA: amidohydrolase family protein, partial [Oleiagrimonas sp.]|nr:amidohydrolase family protein [Oleiagrimonas sp.]
MTTALVNARVLTSHGLQTGFAVLVDEGRISGLALPSDPRVRAAERHDLAGSYLLPGFIDCQVNGGGGVLLNETPTVEGIRAIVAAHRRFGTTGMLPTLISDSPEVMRKAVAAVDEAMAEGMPGVLGIHLEGPFLAPKRKGIHD